MFKNEISSVIEKTIDEISKARRKKRVDLNNSTGINETLKKIDADWFDNLIGEICLKNNINEAHIRRIGGWKIRKK